MLLYTNRTRFPAIVTVLIESTNDGSSSLIVGTETFYEKIAGKTGLFDILVDSGQELHSGEGTNASVFAVRCAP